MASVRMPRTRRATRVVAFLTVGVTGLLFLVLGQYAPDAAGAPDPSADLSPGVYNALQAILAALLTIGVVQILADGFLRETQAGELQRLLKLKGSTVGASLEDVVPEDETDWPALLGRATEVRVLLRDPMTWLPRHQHLLIAAARRDAVTLVVGVPDDDAQAFDEIARGCGLDRAGLQAAIDTAKKTLERAWEGERRLKRGTHFQVVTYLDAPNYEVIVTTDTVVALMPGPRASGAPGTRLAVSFGRDARRYPSQWIADEVDEAFTGRTAIMDKKV